jgi:hypothetical protein
VSAIYIREVVDAHSEAVNEVAQEVQEKHGVPMLLMPHTEAAARHAAENGWIAQSALEEIAREREEEKALPEA